MFHPVLSSPKELIDTAVDIYMYRSWCNHRSWKFESPSHSFNVCFDTFVLMEFLVSPSTSSVLFFRNALQMAINFA